MIIMKHHQTDFSQFLQKRWAFQHRMYNTNGSWWKEFEE